MSSTDMQADAPPVAQDAIPSAEDASEALALQLSKARALLTGSVSEDDKPHGADSAGPLQASPMPAGEPQDADQVTVEPGDKRTAEALPESSHLARRRRLLVGEEQPAAERMPSPIDENAVPLSPGHLSPAASPQYPSPAPSPEQQQTAKKRPG